ncbi:MAG TPA: GNAT family N-acetyltransferase [Flavobacterium sp.]|nr:GNAT family N-acetyltransferase [Flavobacterium sp.]
MDGIIIRKIQKHDDPEIGRLIRSVLIEHNVPKVGTAYADPQLDYMYEDYSAPKAAYFIVENSGKMLGGAGISQLQHETANICELQKMYFLPKARGLGLGEKMMQQCLEAAKGFGYEKCYLETMPYMIAAQKLYKRSGFGYISAPMGNTGHNMCPVWMIKEL